MGYFGLAKYKPYTSTRSTAYILSFNVTEDRGLDTPPIGWFWRDEIHLLLTSHHLQSFQEIDFVHQAELVVHCQLLSVIDMIYQTEFVHQRSQRLIEPMHRRKYLVLGLWGQKIFNFEGQVKTMCV